MDAVAQPAVSQSPLGSTSGCTSHNPAAHHQQEVPLELLLQAASKQGHKVPEGQLQQHKLLAGLSHIHLNGLQLTELPSLRMCPSLQVLYVYDNLLSSIGGISSSRLLTHLYCQHNQLTSLQGLTSLPLLQKLYVQHNRLACIDCLTKAHHLEELHVSDQHAWLACSSAGCDIPAGKLGSCSVQQPQLHSHLQVLQVTHGQLTAAQHQQHQQHQHHQQVDGHSSNGDGGAAVHQPLHQQQQEQLVLYNDGCLVHHTFNSTPPTPPTPLTALQDNPMTQQAAAAGSVAAETGLEGMACSTATSSSSTPATTASTPGGLWFEPASLAAVAGSLQVLAAANCGITDPAPLAVLTRLQVLDLSGNSIASLTVLHPVLAAMQQLQDLDLRRNPCTSSCSSASKYRDCVILAASDCLEQLDGEEVKPAHRAFLHALHSRRAKARQQQQQLLQEQEQLSQQVSSMHMGGGQEHPAADTAAAAVQDYGSQMGAVAAGHHAHLFQRTTATGYGVQGPSGPAVSGMKLQLAAALQPCRGGAPRPSPAAGFKPSPRKAAMGRGAAAAGGALNGDAGQFDDHRHGNHL